MCSASDADLGFSSVRPVMLVDGYNMCGYWPKLKKLFARGELEMARGRLLEDMLTFSGMRGVKVVVAFDAVQSGKATTNRETFHE